MWREILHNIYACVCQSCGFMWKLRLTSCRTERVSYIVLYTSLLYCSWTCMDGLTDQLDRPGLYLDPCHPSLAICHEAIYRNFVFANCYSLHMHSPSAFIILCRALYALYRLNGTTLVKYAKVHLPVYIIHMHSLYRYYISSYLTTFLLYISARRPSGQQQHKRFSRDRDIWLLGGDWKLPGQNNTH